MIYKKRRLENKLRKLLEAFNVVALTGPRQSGKSTLLQHFIKTHKHEKWKYFTLDNRFTLQLIKSDPSLFIADIRSNVVIDEAQKAPELFHSIKELVDKDKPYKIILSGSANFLLMKVITETLAGRVGILELLPFSISELYELNSNNFVKIVINSKNIHELKRQLLALGDKKITHKKLLDFIYNGGFPKIHFLKQNQRWDYFQSYISTYIERDLRDLSQIGNLDVFQSAYKMFAFQSANITNMNSIANDIGVDIKTVKHYFSILEASYQCFHLRAFFSNKRKQLIKKPKIFYLDTGLINFFYENENTDQMLHKGSWGNILETFVFSELHKEIKDMVPKPTLYFFRSNNGAEVDFIISAKQTLFPIEVKSAVQINYNSIRGIKSFMEMEKDKVPFGIVLYRGEDVHIIDKNLIAVPLTYLF